MNRKGFKRNMLRPAWHKSWTTVVLSWVRQAFTYCLMVVNYPVKLTSVQPSSKVLALHLWSTCSKSRQGLLDTVLSGQRHLTQESLMWSQRFFLMTHSKEKSSLDCTTLSKASFFHSLPIGYSPPFKKYLTICIEPTEVRV